MMTFHLRILLPCIAISLAAVTASAETLRPSAAHAKTAINSAKILSLAHYNAPTLDDALSVKIFNRYLDSLDTNHSFFLQSDIDSFQGASTALDDAILGGKLEIPFIIYGRFVDCIRQRQATLAKIIDGDIDFTSNETFTPDRSKAPWAKTSKELNEIWRKRIKNDWLRLKLAGNNNDVIRNTLKKRYDMMLSRTVKLTSDDVFQIFMNAWLATIEPHTNYLGPRASEEFEIAMKLSLSGIGAVLTERDGYVVVRELMAGSPALLSGQIKVGDRIAGVQDGENGKMIDVTGWRVSEVAPIIRGKANSTVIIRVLPAGATANAFKNVKLVRNNVPLEDQAAKSTIHLVKLGERSYLIGAIKLPSFYQDVAARLSTPGQFRSASRDVTRILDDFKKKKVDAVIMDLRNNAGGSLDESISLTGLFIDSGPVVIQHNARGQRHVSSDLIAGTAWDGPLAVLIGRSSASASEIFAAAIQDYGRGLVIGETSFGKGTVQTVMDLDEQFHSPKRQYGKLKLTFAQFFRINGGTTQLRGVRPDITLPSLIDAKTYGESVYDNALPWKQIPPVSFLKAGDLSPLIPKLIERHKTRVAEDEGFRNLESEVKELQSMREKKTTSLNINVRRAERERQLALTRALGKSLMGDAYEAVEDLNDDGLLTYERSLTSELAAEKARKAARDVLLDETANILGDLIELQGKKGKR